MGIINNIEGLETAPLLILTLKNMGELEKRIIRLEKELKDAQNNIQNLIRYRDNKEDKDDPFNGYF